MPALRLRFKTFLQGLVSLGCSSGESLWATQQALQATSEREMSSRALDVVMSVLQVSGMPVSVRSTVFKPTLGDFLAWLGRVVESGAGRSRSLCILNDLEDTQNVNTMNAMGFVQTLRQVLPPSPPLFIYLFIYLFIHLFISYSLSLFLSYTQIYTHTRTHAHTPP